MNSTREKAIAFCEAVVPAVVGDDAFEFVTQGRQGPKYSACADLGHALLHELGVRTSILVNREAPPLRWVPGVNVNRLYDGARKLGVWREPKQFVVPQAADIVIIGDSTKGQEPHVLVFRSLEESAFAGSWWRSYDYGQVNEAGHACATICNRQRIGRQLAGRDVLGWIDLDLVAERLALAS